MCSELSEGKRAPIQKPDCSRNLENRQNFRDEGILFAITFFILGAKMRMLVLFTLLV
jgi:hypothetical protein